MQERVLRPHGALHPGTQPSLVTAAAILSNSASQLRQVSCAVYTLVMYVPGRKGAHLVRASTAGTQGPEPGAARSEQSRNQASPRRRSRGSPRKRSRCPGTASCRTPARCL